MAKMKATWLDRFWAKVDRRGPDECWLWMASLNKGYGQFGRGDGNPSTSTLAHRISYELLVGPIPEGLVIDHLCRTPRCVNPAHMEPVTFHENLRRGIRGRRPPVTHCPQGHEMNEANTHIWNNHRNCRTCARERAAAAYRPRPKRPLAAFCGRGHAMDERNTYMHRGRRSCKQCRADYAKRRYFDDPEAALDYQRRYRALIKMSK